MTSYQKSIIQNGKQSQISSSLNVSQPSSFFTQEQQTHKTQNIQSMIFITLKGLSYGFKVPIGVEKVFYMLSRSILALMMGFR